MNSNIKRLLVTLTLGLGLTLALVWMLGGQAMPVTAAPAATTRYVDDDTGSDDSDCGDPGDPCQTIQYAVDVADDGDEILVATGIYTGVNVRSRDDVTTTGAVTQVVYVSKTVTIRGGYTAAFTGPPDPEANQTTLDAQGQGRVFYVIGPSAGSGQVISLTLEGLRVTGGDATGLEGDPWWGDVGGGIYVYTATATISNCVVYSNTASTTGLGAGGGLALYGSVATLSGNTVQDNVASTADWAVGGGIKLWKSSVTLTGNTVQNNTAGTSSVGGEGGGIYLFWANNAMLTGNTVQSNTAGTDGSSNGGGLYIEESPGIVLSDNTVQGNTASITERGYGGGVHCSETDDATFDGNVVRGNTASVAYEGYGGGMHLRWSSATLNGNIIISNTATLSSTARGWGGGLRVGCGDSYTLTNNLVAGNHANTLGSGLWFDGYSKYATFGFLLHNTIADNHGSGQGIYAEEYVTPTFTNTIIAGHHSAGIVAAEGSTVTLEATLWHDNGANTGGEGTILTGTVNITGTPAFADPSAWDYHLTADSAAINEGVDVSAMPLCSRDIDEDPRPQGDAPDIGADEFQESYQIYLPLVLKND